MLAINATHNNIYTFTMILKTVSKQGKHALLFLNKKRSVTGLTPSMRRTYDELLAKAAKRDASPPYQHHAFGLGFGPPLWRKWDYFWFTLLMILILL